MASLLTYGKIAPSQSFPHQEIFKTSPRICFDLKCWHFFKCGISATSKPVLFRQRNLFVLKKKTEDFSVLIKWRSHFCMTSFEEKLFWGKPKSHFRPSFYVTRWRWLPHQRPITLRCLWRPTRPTRPTRTTRPTSSGSRVTRWTKPPKPSWPLKTTTPHSSHNTKNEKKDGKD